MNKALFQKQLRELLAIFLRKNRKSKKMSLSQKSRFLKNLFPKSRFLRTLIVKLEKSLKLRQLIT